MIRITSQFLPNMVMGMRLQVVDIIASHPDHDIIIGIDSLGKEDLLLHISRVLKIKVCTSAVICNLCYKAIN